MASARLLPLSFTRSRSPERLAAAAVQPARLGQPRPQPARASRSPHRPRRARTLRSPRRALHRCHGELRAHAHGAVAHRTARPAPRPSAARLAPRPLGPVHRGPVHSAHAPGTPWTRQSRAATWPASSATRAPPGRFAKRPLPLFKINPRSSSVILSFKICPCFYSLAPAAIGICSFNPNLVLISFKYENSSANLQNCHPTCFSHNFCVVTPI